MRCRTRVWPALQSHHLHTYAEKRTGSADRLRVVVEKKRELKEALEKMLTHYNNTDKGAPRGVQCWCHARREVHCVPALAEGV